MAVRIRHGRANDAEFLAWAMFAASRAHLARGLWDLIIGGNEAQCLDYLRRLALAEPRSLYHCESFLIAEVDGAPAAALTGFQTDNAWERVGDAMANVQRDLGWTEADTAASYQRVGPVWGNCMPPDIGADFIIESVATLPQHRRQGLIRWLIDEALADARRRECRLAQITTYIGNAPAQTAYERSGFNLRDEKRCDIVQSVLGVPGFMRLTRDLTIS